MTWHPEILQHYALTTTELAYMPPGTVVANLRTGDRYHATNPKPHSTDIWQIINPYNGLPEPELRTLTDTLNDWYSIAPYGLARPAPLTPEQIRKAPLGTLLVAHTRGPYKPLDKPHYLATRKTTFANITCYTQVDPHTLKSRGAEIRLDADTHHDYRPPTPTRTLNQHDLNTAPPGTRIHSAAGTIYEATDHDRVTYWTDVDPDTNKPSPRTPGLTLAGQHNNPHTLISGPPNHHPIPDDPLAAFIRKHGHTN